jgi:hypothetical protein
MDNGALLLFYVGATPVAVRRLNEPAIDVTGRSIPGAHKGETVLTSWKTRRSASKVTPDSLVQGADNIGGLLSAFLTKNIAGPAKTMSPR